MPELVDQKEKDKSPLDNEFNVVNSRLTTPSNMAFDVDSLIPEELRTALKEAEGAAVAEPISSSKAPTPQQQYDVTKEEPVQEIRKQSTTLEELDEEDIDLSTDALEKLLDGDLNAVVPKKTAEELANQAPFWHEDEDYKKLYQRASSTGLKQDDIDKVITAVADKRVINNTKYTQGLETQLNELKKQQDLYSTELTRLKQIEREAFFDNMPETMEHYRSPMLQTAKEIQGILDIEGVAIPVEKLVFAKNKAEFIKQLKDYDIEDSSLTQLTNHWRSYKELQLRYETDRTKAKQSLKENLNISVPDDVVRKVFSNSLSDVLETDERYAYMKPVATEGWDKHPRAAEIASQAQKNFKNILNAIGNPFDYIHSEKWLSGLAKYTLDASHKNHIESEYYTIKEAYDKQTEMFKKVVAAYRQQAESGKGITGNRGGIPYKNGRDNVTPQLSSAERDKKEFEAFLRNEIRIEDLLP